eukprot:CAMPEP_0195150684 /NCGR_PEP_ID=MMETSP0448-20130528/179246_1 /TAXON_ID=66468 /ORGANISM="Heterocapsa triquestra, Strain CCMP 448" /LENGTH=56 /DNA_ID=CAMNT_0040189369 /DNA_START=8 /DNA_END=175 /DNA_ORIENTATION=-
MTGASAQGSPHLPPRPKSATTRFARGHHSWQGRLASAAAAARLSMRRTKGALPPAL